MKIHLLFLITGLSLLQVGVRANDFGVSGVGGTYFPIKGEHRSIRMVREKIRVDIYENLNSTDGPDRYYDTAIDFVFKNDGAATTVEMAFPESAEGADAGYANEPSFRFFRTSVNGKGVKVSRIIASRKLSSGLSCEALWVKKVSFGKGETKAVRVVYRSPWGNLAGVGNFAAYNFTGGNWKGKVEQSQLTVYLHVNENKPQQAFFNGKQIEGKGNKNSFSYNWRDWEADGSFRFWFDIEAGGIQSINDHYNGNE